jgi:signal transduction histidine kinase
MAGSSEVHGTTERAQDDVADAVARERTRLADALHDGALAQLVVARHGL